jgi:iron complex transport system substrate-binding protein
MPPSRIVCLTEETVETLYLLGEDSRIVGVSGYAVRPARVRKEKPRVSAFISADLPKILALEPDLVLAFSDLQAEIVAGLIRAGVEVHAFNQRDLGGIFGMIRTLGALVDANGKAEALADSLRAKLDNVQAAAQRHPYKPRVYFEEWDEPMISGIRWVSELIGIAGGTEAFPELSNKKSAPERIVLPEQVIEARPDIIIGSWCGKKFVPAKVAARPGFDTIPAVRDNFLREIKSPLILQPGPAALTDGLDAIAAIIEEWQRTKVTPARPREGGDPGSRAGFPPARE